MLSKITQSRNLKAIHNPVWLALFAVLVVKDHTISEFESNSHKRMTVKALVEVLQ